MPGEPARSHSRVIGPSKAGKSAGTGGRFAPLWYAGGPGNLESLLSGATPDPARPVTTPDALARLKLTQALQQARIGVMRWCSLIRRRFRRFNRAKHTLRGDQKVDVIQFIAFGWVHALKFSISPSTA